MAHEHSHEHAARGHDHGLSTGRAFVIGVVLNTAIVVVEVVYGVLARSMALLADAGHNLGDVLGLVLGLGAAYLAKRKPTSRHTYGFRRATILSALANAILLLVATGAIGWESIHRLRTPEPIAPIPVLIVAAIAIVVNGASALMFFAERKRDLNVRAAFLHLASDAAVSVGVVIAALVIMKTEWEWLDPVVGLGLSIAILLSTWSLLRHSFSLSLDAVPAEIDLDEVRRYLCALRGIREVHDLHVWGLSTTDTALTAHLVLAEGAATEASFFAEVSKALREKFGIGHATLQVEHATAGGPCDLAPEDVV